MIRVRRSNERGHLDHGWLDTYHTFSFGSYDDPKHRGFRALRVINEDWIEAGAGFGMHPHRDMEIITYVLEGALAHRDSLGNGGAISAGELQCMTAGTGIRHSEANPSATGPVHLYQIWLHPDREGLPPRYAQRGFDPEGRRGRWQTVAAPDGRDGALPIHQDATLSLATLEDGQEIAHTFTPGRHAWLQVVRGGVTVNGQALAAGDGAAIHDEAELNIKAREAAEVMLFDLA